MNGRRLRNLTKLCFFYVVFSLTILPLVIAQQKGGFEDHAQDASPAQAQATMASLFGRGAKMPGIPHMGGTIALPSFDSSGMKIDEATVRQSQRGDPRPAASD